MNSITTEAATGVLAGKSESDVIQGALETIREHLGMEVAYLSEFVDDKAVFRRVDAPGLEHLIKAGDIYELGEIYCHHVLEGRLPKLIPDTSNEPIAAAMPVTSAVPVGAYAGVPIKLENGRVFGMFCCLSRFPIQSLDERDLRTMEMFANLVAKYVNDDVTAANRRRRARDRIAQLLESNAFRVVYQPIRDIRVCRLRAFEALCRFDAEPLQSPEQWFADAADAGMAVELDLAVMDRAIPLLRHWPNDIYLSLNASPETLTDPRLAKLLSKAPAKRIILELTEAAPVTDYAQIERAIEPIKRMGCLLAVDDAGAGFASLRHIIQLKPDIIKLDMSLTRDVDRDAARRALATGLIFFARETGACMVAEGIETKGELTTLTTLGVDWGQGFHLSRPVSAQEATRLACEASGSTAESARKAV